MADMGLGSGFAAGAGADALQAQLTQLFQQAVAKQHMAQEQQRIQIEQQNANDNSAYRRMQEQDRADALKAASAQKGAAEGLQFANTLPEGTRLSQSGLAKLGAAGMNGPEFVQHTDPTLASRNIEGAGQAGTTAPVAALKIASVLNPGSPEQNTFLGTAQRQAANQARQDKLAAEAQARQDRIDQISQARQDKIDAGTQGAQNREDMLRLAASLRPAPQDHFQLVPGQGPDGKPAMFRVNAQTGESSIVTGVPGKAAPLDSTTANRLQSAKAVTQTGDDIVAMLSDPKVIAQLGPAMSRYNSVADFVGNPPPEFSKLAGMIESYSLANMGVHGMRSNTGAEAIKGTLGLKSHTPQSMIATIQGINGFANHLLDNNGQGATAGGPAAPAKETPEQRIKRILGGG